MNDYFNEDFLTDQEVKKSKKKILIGTLVSLCILISLIIFALYELISTTSKMFSPNEELLSESFSPDNKYKVEAYLVDGGATTDFCVKCILFVDNKKSKTIYSDYHIRDANIEWVDNDTVSINSHIIDLPDGKYDWTIDKTGTD
ncbi:DUF5412 family protein [Clostridium paraputrificum]|uniref:DUF5412 family protein n=1 Tax=Clostridium paraputrificum TaxID=29363 RepID=UPI00189C8DF5|nr:DUF5412 family protein [Clostridium paraputrificum]